MKGFKQKLFWLTVISAVLFFASFHPFVKAEEEKSAIISLKIQSIIRGVWHKISQILPLKEENYKEKYFRILREFAELKLQEKEIKTGQSFEILKSKYPNAFQSKTLKIGEAGVIYLERPYPTESKISKAAQIKENSIVLDDNFLLVGKIYKITPNFLEARSLGYPGTEFNIADTDRNLLGIGKTTGLGYIEMDLINQKTQDDIEKDELVVTYGGDKVFPQNFIFGRIVKIEKEASLRKAIIAPIADFSSDYYFILP
jgi:hypothetical protein